MPLYASFDLKPHLEKKLEAHLATCSQCQQELDSLKRALASFKEMAQQKELQWPDLCWASLMEQIKQEKTKPVPLFVRNRRLALGFSLMILLLGIILINLPREKWKWFPLSSLTQKIKEMPAKEISPAFEEKATAEKTEAPSLSKEKSLPSEIPAPVKIKKKEAASFVASLNEKEKPLDAPPVEAPDKITINLFLPETGIQVIWILNKDFDWQGAIK
jgi:anti-sigma factor RsiW